MEFVVLDKGIQRLGRHHRGIHNQVNVNLKMDLSVYNWAYYGYRIE